MIKVICNDKKERILLIIGVIAFFLLLISELRLPLFCSLIDSSVEKILSSDALKNIVSSISSGIFSAYIFYIFIDLIPRYKKEQETLGVLNALIATVLDSYNRVRVFGHETAIAYVDKTCLEEQWLKKQLQILQEDKANFHALKFAMDTAYSRLEDFRGTLSLAVSLSPDHAFKWLMIIDKIKLLAEMYQKFPLVDDKEKLLKSDLRLRMLEIIEVTIEWLYSET